MGLPRALKDDLRSLLLDGSKSRLIIMGLNVGMSAPSHVIDKVVTATKDIGLSQDQQALALFRWGYRHCVGSEILSHARVTAPDGMTRVKARLYVGLQREEKQQRDCAVFRDVEVPRYFLARLEQENKKREERDREALVLRERIKEIRARVYASRTFPVTLKAIIFERDKYTCRMCLRDRIELQKAGLHLECDHILAWEDGGMTTYDNGQTICSGCNKAKHHAKSYFGMVARLKGRSE